MLAIIRRVTSRMFRRARIEDQPDRRPHGALLTLIENDLHNIDQLTQALKIQRR